jgi:hypothetical protein
MYNTDFVVRYHEIENELIMNLHRKFMKKQEEEERIEREEKSAASKAAAAKVVAAVVAILNFEKEKELEKEKEKEKELEKEKEQIIPVKNKGGRKKATSAAATSVTATSVMATTTSAIEEPKKRGRKKAVVVNEPIVNETIVNEPIKISITIEPVKLEHKEKVDKNNEDGDGDDDDDEDLEYSMDDVHLICEKLYRDELLSVFNVETINDENMDAGIKKAIEKMVDNVGFKQILEEIKQELMDLSNPTGTPEEIENIRRNLEYLIFITLFSQQVFYITHKCICQLFTVDEVHPDLLDRLKEKTIGLFKKN